MRVQTAMKTQFKTAIFATVLTVALPATAKVSSDEAARLGQDLTLVGAEKAGNADGSIPAFTGEVPKFSQEVISDPRSHLPNPYADEKPLFVITAENYKQYADKLSDGMQQMFQKYPETFKMPVYKTHRNGTFKKFA